MKHDAKLQNLRLSRGTDVLTISSGGRSVSVYVTFSMLLGHLSSSWTQYYLGSLAGIFFPEFEA